MTSFILALHDRLLTVRRGITAAFISFLTALFAVSSLVSPASAATSDIHPQGAEHSVGQLNGYLSCSAVFISPRWALSAQHCASHGSRVTISAGVNRDQGNFAGTVFAAPERADMILVKLDGHYNGPTASLASRPSFPGEQGRIVGYGGYDVARVAPATTTNPFSGSKHSNHGGSYVEVGIAPSHARYGDSGGPLFIGGQVHGVFSNGYTNHDHLGPWFYDGRFTSTLHFAPWIHATMASH